MEDAGAGEEVLHSGGTGFLVRSSSPPSPSPTPAAAREGGGPYAAAKQPAADPAPKRRWSPCTWRYAIEEVQPEVGSKPRQHSLIGGAPHRSKASADDPFFSNHQQIPSSRDSPARPIFHHHSHQASKKKQQQQQRHHHPDAHAEGTVPAARNLKPLHREAPCRKPPSSHVNVIIHSSRSAMASSSREGPGEEDEAEGNAATAPEEESAEALANRRIREMSPSELYFCEICSAASLSSRHTRSGSLAGHR